MKKIKSLNAINQLNKNDFVAYFEGVLEHSPQYAIKAYENKPFYDVEDLANAFFNAFKNDTLESQISLINAHPDLAGKAALSGDLTKESASEQNSAGLNSLSPAEYAEFHRINEAYHKKFGLPYVVCVRENTKETIFSLAIKRLSNSIEEERNEALYQIGRIARLRILDLVSDSEL